MEASPGPGGAGPITQHTRHAAERGQLLRWGGSPASRPQKAGGDMRDNRAYLLPQLFSVSTPIRDNVDKVC